MSATRNKKLIVLALILVVLIAAAAILYSQYAAKPVPGAKALAITITHGDKSVKELTLHTDAEYLRGALEEADLVAGTESEYGLYVLTIDGETVDENAQEWWCFTKNGEQVNTGVDLTPISDGEAYEITLTVGW